jgi:hypothetical protein
MDMLPVVSNPKTGTTIDERIELILDLTRRLELLDELLENARARRSATHAEFRVVDMDHAVLEAMITR